MPSRFLPRQHEGYVPAIAELHGCRLGGDRLVLPTLFHVEASTLPLVVLTELAVDGNYRFVGLAL
ncbi:MAG: hypothetical protein IPI29_08475 [Ignavibacteria bacterium]|nr:hypothetical protein [Ignavibacteria bacterium]